jgi:hypothetical protein
MESSNGSVAKYLEGRGANNLGSADADRMLRMLREEFELVEVPRAVAARVLRDSSARASGAV